MKVETLNKSELIEYCMSIGLNTSGVGKSELLEMVRDYRKAEIVDAIRSGNDLGLLKSKLKKLADEYAENLKNKISERTVEMASDDNSHYLIYRVLGITESEGAKIDLYQNTGRFLYKYAGSFLEEAATLCLSFANLDGKKTTVENTIGSRPARFEIDFLNGQDAIEIKWRDATTDGDHITKEHTRVQVISSHGFKPIRVMFYYPQRVQAIKIQETLKTLYAGVNGEYYAGEDAWNYIKNSTNYDLQSILLEIANER